MDDRRRVLTLTGEPGIDMLNSSSNHRSRAIFALFVGVSLSAFAQRESPALCIVQTKPNGGIQYDPSAGRYAIAMDKQLEGHRLPDGTRLNITVLAATIDQQVLPEVRRLRCTRVLQLWFHGNADGDLYSSGSPVDLPTADPEPVETFPQPIGDQDSLIFTLWEPETQRVLARGASPLVYTSPVPGERPMFITRPYIALANQILKKLKAKR